MNFSFLCPSCGATYDTDQVAPGTTFTCGACEAEVTAPTAPPRATKPPGGRPSAGGSRPPQRRGAPAPRARSAPAAKSRGPLYAIIGVALAAVVTLVVVNMSGGGGSKDTDSGPSVPAGPPPEEVAQQSIAETLKPFDASTAQGVADGVKALKDRATELEGAKANPTVVSLLRQRAIEMDKTVLQLDPHFAPYREARGERKYNGELEPFLSVPWLTESERVDANRLHGSILDATKKDHGWAKASAFTKVDALLAQLEPKRAARDTLESSEFFTKVKTMEKTILSDLDQRFTDILGKGWDGAEMRIDAPFVFFVQKDPSWDPLRVTRSRSDSLHKLQAIIIKEFGEELGLKPVEEPVPVLLFRNHDMYLKYSGASKDVFAHFEPHSGRLAIHDQCEHSTVMHEGTHQLMWFWSTSKTGKSPEERSYWFQEGIAEWYSTSDRVPKADGGYDYEIGLFEEGRMGNIARLMSPDSSKLLFNIRELVQCRYATRPKIERTHRTGALYAQGWFIIYFLNHYNADENGRVLFNGKGKYADRWNDYVKAELQGETGFDVFMEKMALNEASLKVMEEEFWRYAKWCIKKGSLKAIKDKRILPWDQQKNRRGEPVGDPSDDILEPVDPTHVPAFERDTIGRGDDAGG